MTFPVPRQNYKNVLVIRANAVSDFRMNLAHRHITRAGYDADIITEVPFYKASQYDVILCCRPGASMLEFLKVCIIAGKRVIIDLDDDFYSIPKHNPAYTYTGAGHPTYLNELKRVLLNPAVVTTFASKELCNRYKLDGIIVPNYIDEENENWRVPNRDRGGYINIGFSGTSTHREDFNLVEPVLHKLFAEYPQLRLVVSLDDQIYNRFGELTEERKIYIPGLPYDDYPLIYSYIDILIVPLRDTHFNRAKSDVKLVECGYSKTAYVASDMPVYKEWGVGGLTAGVKDWEASIRTLIDNPDKIVDMGEAGYEKALTRTSEVVCKKWVDLIGEMCK